jgi:hypothetical protein
VAKGADVRRLPLIIADPAATGDKTRLTEDQKQADKILTSLTKQTQGMIRQLQGISMKGAISKENLTAMKDLRTELAKFIDDVEKGSG